MPVNLSNFVGEFQMKNIFKLRRKAAFFSYLCQFSCTQLLLVKTESSSPSVVTLTTTPATAVTQATHSPVAATIPTAPQVNNTNAIVTTTIPVQVGGLRGRVSQTTEQTGTRKIALTHLFSSSLSQRTCSFGHTGCQWGKDGDRADAVG